MAKGAKGGRVGLSIRAETCGVLVLSAALSQMGCHRKRSGVVPPRATSTPTATAAPPSTADRADEPYWSPAHVLVLPKSTDAVDDMAARDVVEKAGGKCGLREVAPGVWVRLECEPFQKISGTREAFSPTKMQLLREGRLHVARGAPT